MRTRGGGPCSMIALLLVAAPVSADGPKVPTANSRLPNIVILVADDLGWSDVGYHNSEMRTPTIDRLAADGVELDMHYVQPQCTPTRVALLTGRYPSRFGRHCTQASNERALPEGTPTIASLLKHAGYRSAIVGKWHLGSLPEWGPNGYGFDFSYGSLAGAVGMYDHRYRLTRPRFTRTWHRNHEYVDDEGHATDLVAREAIRQIENAGDTPLFLYVPFHAVHVPLVEPRPWIQRNEHIVSEDRRLFAAAVTHLDDAIGRIVDALDRTETRASTLIIFTSDNGGLHHHRGNVYPPPDPALSDFSSNAPLRGQKGRVYEGGMRVPAFAHWPGRLEPACRTAPVHVVDWLPTIIGRTGVRTDRNLMLDGHDIWAVLTGENASPAPRTLYWVWGVNRQRVALRHGDWKIVRDEKEEEFELFRLDEDPYETTDLAQSEPEKLATLKHLFEQEMKRDAL